MFKCFFILERLGLRYLVLNLKGALWAHVLNGWSPTGTAFFLGSGDTELSVGET